MISNPAILFHVLICIHISCMGPCFDGSNSYDCTCSTVTQIGVIGTCNCAAKTPANVRQGHRCAYDTVNSVDSVRLQYIYCELTNS